MEHAQGRYPMSAGKATRAPKAPTLAAHRRALVERAFPGVRCKRVAFECAYASRNFSLDFWKDWVDGRRYNLAFTVEGSAETLIEHGFVTRAYIDALPPSGRRSGFCRTNRGTYQANITYWEGGGTTDARQMAAKLGITDPVAKEWNGEKWVVVERAARKPGGNVIQFPKKNPRAVTPINSYLADAATVPGFIAIYVPSDMRANLVGSALACIGLRCSDDGGKLVARWATAQEGQQP